MGGAAYGAPCRPSFLQTQEALMALVNYSSQAIVTPVGDRGGSRPGDTSAPGRLAGCRRHAPAAGHGGAAHAAPCRPSFLQTQEALVVLVNYSSQALVTPAGNREERQSSG